MKRLLFIAVLILLVACSDDVEVHENVDKDLATDTLQVIEILEELSDEQKEPSEKQQTVFDEYLKKYGYQYEQGKLEGPNETIYEYTESTLTGLLDRVTALDSGTEYVEDLRITIEKYIRDGE